MKIKTRDMILVALFAALTAVGALISIPIGEVPITLQILFTALSGVMLGAKLGALSQVIYIAIGLIGAPVFAGGKGGVSVIFGPTFGYLIGFVIGAYVIGKIAEGSNRPSFKRLLFASLMGLVVIYAIGFPYLYLILTKVNNFHVTFYGVLKTGVLVFIPGDLAKCILTAFLGVRIIPTLKKEILR